ncbi:MAG TPA: triose-phosphate isomerase, partial [Gammaproteobacteria bacterium]|nr:triose-phosphate isomerase [Gammaproteobacteria bacterium]
MRQPLVAGNWKMNGTAASIDVLMAGIKHGLADVKTAAVVVCPPFVYIAKVAELAKGSKIGVGSQDISDQESGAFTGEISGPMLKDTGCQYAIVGHSERRAIYGESDAFT